MCLKLAHDAVHHSGSAIDAAVAVQATLGLVEPQSSGLGGGALLPWYDPKTRAVPTPDGREAPPAGPTQDQLPPPHATTPSHTEAVPSAPAPRAPGPLPTRPNIPFTWPKLEPVPDILADLATVEMHAIQTSGNCIRNITSDHLAGVAADELIDPRPYCEITRQWATFHPEFNWLPRKFKIAFSSSTTDRAATVVHDIGVHIIRNAAGELGYTMYVGGGLGRTPIIGVKIREFLPELDLLSYCEAILRVYNRLGRRDNIY